MNEKEMKKQVVKISIFITSIFVIFISISYAFINQTLLGTKRQVITAGNLELRLEEGESITLENALPMYDEVGMIQKSFDFTLQNNADVDTNYTLKLVDITPNGTQKLDTSLVKYGLEKNGVKKIKFLSNLTDGALDSGIIGRNQIINYTLRFWIDSEVEDEALIKNKSLSYRVDVVVSKNAEIVKNWPVMQARGMEGIWVAQEYVDVPRTDRYWNYSDRIAEVLFEDAIDIPNNVEESEKWDMSEKQDGGVMAYVENYETLESGEMTYKLHIQGDGGVTANPDSSYLFYEFPNLQSITGLEYFDTSKVTNMSGMFLSYSSPAVLDLSKLDTSNVTNMFSMFSNYSSPAVLDLSKLDTSNVTNMSSMFSIYSSPAVLDLSELDTSNVTNMSSMFSNYSSDSELKLGSWETGENADMFSMFSSYSSSSTLDLSSFDTSKVTDMTSMFSDYSSSSTLDLSSFDTSKVTDMTSMFSSYSSSSTLDLSSFNTSNVTDMTRMFDRYSSPAELKLGNWETGENATMLCMFDNYSSTSSLDLSHFDISKVTNMAKMFYDYSSTSPLDLSNWDITDQINVEDIFAVGGGHEANYTVIVKNDSIRLLLAQGSHVYWPTIVVVGSES